MNLINFKANFIFINEFIEIKEIKNKMVFF